MNPETRIGPYQLTTKVGAGGMDEAFRARDTGVYRDVTLQKHPIDTCE